MVDDIVLSSPYSWGGGERERERTYLSYSLLLYKLVLERTENRVRHTVARVESVRSSKK